MAVYEELKWKSCAFCYHFRYFREFISTLHRKCWKKWKNYLYLEGKSVSELCESVPENITVCLPVLPGVLAWIYLFFLQEELEHRNLGCSLDIWAMGKYPSPLQTNIKRNEVESKAVDFWGPESLLEWKTISITDKIFISSMFFHPEVFLGKSDC